MRLKGFLNHVLTSQLVGKGSYVRHKFVKNVVTNFHHIYRKLANYYETYYYNYYIAIRRGP